MDDSVAVRGLLRRIIDRQDDMEVVAACADGKVAVETYPAARPDIVLLDIEMPRMNGLETLRHLLTLDADARTIMCSSQTCEGSTMTFRALNEGALDYLSKPTTQTVDCSLTFEEALLRKLRALCKRSVQTISSPSPSPFPLQLQSTHAIIPDIIAIGASTGGPKALERLLRLWSGAPGCPVLITQHIPLGFTAALAASLQRASGLSVCEAEDGMPLTNGKVYIAPGQRHLTLKQNAPPAILLSDAPPVNYCRPSVDVMLQSIATVYPRNVLTIILTGMGEDGRTGCKALQRQSADNLVLVQDEVSSVVWGMPGAVAKAGCAHAILNIEAIADHVRRMERKRSIL